MKYSKAFIFLTGFLVSTTAPAFCQEALVVNYNQFLTSNRSFDLRFSLLEIKRADQVDVLPGIGRNVFDMSAG